MQGVRISRAYIGLVLADLFGATQERRVLTKGADQFEARNPEPLDLVQGWADMI